MGKWATYRKRGSAAPAAEGPLVGPPILADFIAEYDLAILLATLQIPFPPGVEWWQGQWSPGGEGEWTSADPSDAPSTNLASELDPGNYDVQIRWYSGAGHPLPSAWSPTQVVVVPA